jgi:hypothetical protein
MRGWKSTACSVGLYALAIYCVICAAILTLVLYKVFVRNGEHLNFGDGLMMACLLVGIPKVAFWLVDRAA